jgi:hypothetical protein
MFFVEFKMALMTVLIKKAIYLIKNLGMDQYLDFPDSATAWYRILIQ